MTHSLVETSRRNALTTTHLDDVDRLDNDGLIWRPVRGTLGGAGKPVESGGAWRSHGQSAAGPAQPETGDLS